MNTIESPVELTPIVVSGELFVVLHESSPGFWFAGMCSFNRSEAEATVRRVRSEGQRCELACFNVPKATP